MNHKMIAYIIAQILAVETVFMIPACLIGFFVDGYSIGMAYVYSILISAVVSLLFWLYSKEKKTSGKNRKNFSARDGLSCVGLAWIFMSILGALPLVISGEFPNFIDALFEMVSGFTTTGASVCSNVDLLSKATNYWRCFSHWLGGMGVLVFVLAILPHDEHSGGYTMHLLRAESPGPNVGKLVPKMRTTAFILYILYFALTILNIIFLLIGKMPFYDAICTAFGTAGTGGFGIHADSISGYSSYLQNVCTVFMLLFGVNFTIYYFVVTRQFREILKNDELKYYLFIFAASTIAIFLNIKSMYSGAGESLKHAAFQVSSIMTTTGFVTTDYDKWPEFSKVILLMLMIGGACAGSTGGGLKCSRILLLFKSIKRYISQIIHPQKISAIRADGQVINEKVLNDTSLYFAVYSIITIISIIVVALDGFSVSTDVSAVLACFNNIGPGLDIVGPTSNYAAFSILSKLVLIFDMLAGRLEIFPILILFTGFAGKDRK